MTNNSTLQEKLKASAEKLKNEKDAIWREMTKESLNEWNKISEKALNEKLNTIEQKMLEQSKKAMMSLENLKQDAFYLKTWIIVLMLILGLVIGIGAEWKWQLLVRILG